MFGHNHTRKHIKVSNACSHVQCYKRRQMHINFIDDSDTMHGLVSGDGNFPMW